VYIDFISQSLLMLWFLLVAIHGVFKESVTITIAHTYSKGIEQTPRRLTLLAHE